MKKDIEKENTLREINDEIHKERNVIWNTPEYKLLEDEENKLWREHTEKEKEIRRLRIDIQNKYTKSNSYYFGRLDIKNIKSSVKEGIKRGLGVKYINLIDERDIIKIVEKLIADELEKTNEKELLSNAQKLDEELRIKRANKRKFEEDKLSTLTEKKKEIENNIIDKDKLDKEKIKEGKRKELNKIIGEKLPELIETIQKEVRRGFLLDGITK